MSRSGIKLVSQVLTRDREEHTTAVVEIYSESPPNNTDQPVSWDADAQREAEKSQVSNGPII